MIVEGPGLFDILRLRDRENLHEFLRRCGRRRIITDRNRWAVVKSYKATSRESRDVREGRFASVPFVGFTENSCGSGWWRR